MTMKVLLSHRVCSLETLLVVTLVGGLAGCWESHCESVRLLVLSRQ